MLASLRKRRERFTSNEFVPPLLAVLGIVAAIRWDQHFDIVAGPIFCGFRRLTELPCPGCGLTRSVVTLGNGDLVGAFDHHPLGVVFMAVLGAIILSWLFAIVVNRPPRPIITSRLISIVALLCALNWGVQFL